MTARESAYHPFGISSSHPLNQRPYFFDDGIRFECRQCGKCCTGAPGIVRVSENEISAICRLLNADPHEFAFRYLHSGMEGCSIREDAQGRCLFYENGCRIYEARPAQCRTFPFWVKNFRSEEQFNSIAKDCPGIGNGRRFSREEILATLAV